MARAGVDGDRNRDQHFLVDDRILDRLPGYAEDFDCSTVLEVGAGTGALTDRLLAGAALVYAIERDPALADFLRTEFRNEIDAGRLSVVEGDATTVELPTYTTCVSNLPYGVSSPVLFRLLPRRRPTVLMVQREFGERMAAEPGSSEYGRLSVTAQHYADVETLEVVPPEAFDPAPPVESVVIRTTPCEPIYDVPEEEAFLAVVRAVFTQRRKTLRNAIRNTTHISGIADASAVVAALPDDTLAARPGSLAPETFAQIATVAASHGGFE